MNKKVFVCLMIIFLVPALACGLASGGNKSAVGQVSLQAVSTGIPSPTNLPVVEDIEQVREETPEPALVVSTINNPLVTDTVIAAPEDGPSLAALASDDNDEQEDTEDAKAGTNDIVVHDTATTTSTPTPIDTPTPTPSPTLTPSPVAVSSGWPPILPDAAGLEYGDGYVRYITGSGVGVVAEFYRREMAGYGWAEMNEPDLAAALGLADFSTLVPMPDGGTLLIFSKDGGETLSFVIISEAGGKVGVALIWLVE